MANNNEVKIVKSVLPGVIFGTIIVVAVGLVGNAMTKKK